MNYVKDYAEKVISGEILAGKKVILAAKRFINDLERQEDDDFEYYFDNERANKVIGFMEILPDPKTMQAYPLADFQRFIIGNMYGWWRKMTTLNVDLEKVCYLWPEKMVNRFLFLVLHYMSFY